MVIPLGERTEQKKTQKLVACIMCFSGFLLKLKYLSSFIVAEVVLICVEVIVWPLLWEDCGSCQNLFILTFSFRYLPVFLFVLFLLSLSLKHARQKRKAAPWHSYLFVQLLPSWQVNQKPCVKSPLNTAVQTFKVSKGFQVTYHALNAGSSQVHMLHSVFSNLYKELCALWKIPCFSELCFFLIRRVVHQPKII